MTKLQPGTPPVDNKEASALILKVRLALFGLNEVLKEFAKGIVVGATGSHRRVILSFAKPKIQEPPPFENAIVSPLAIRTTRSGTDPIGIPLDEQFIGIEIVGAATAEGKGLILTRTLPMSALNRTAIFEGKARLNFMQISSPLKSILLKTVRPSKSQN
jgi:hypothetical protein